MKHPTPDQLPEDFELDLAPKFAPWPQRFWLVVACLIGGPILVGALIAVVDALT